MAGAQQRRAKVERKGGAPSVGESSNSASATHTESASAPSRASRSPPIGTKYDGNRDPAVAGPPAAASSGPMVMSSAMKNMDLGGGAFDVVRGHKCVLAGRPPAPSKLGRDISMGLNTFAVDIPTIRVHQYQVLVGSGAEKRGLIKKAWESNAIQSSLPNPSGWIFDGNALAWSKEPVSELRIQVDLDAEQGRRPRANGKSNVHRVVIKPTNDVDFTSLDAYLNRKADFDPKCLEAVTFMDHLMREYPSKQYTQIKRSFFAKGQKRFDLGGGVEAFKGCYQSLRIAHAPGGIGRLTCNVDVANGTFFTGGDMKNVVTRVLGLRSEAEISQLARSEGKGKFNELKRLRKLHVHTEHRGRGQRDDYVIDRFIPDSAANYKIDVRGDNGQSTKQSLQQFFQSKYSLRLQYPNWPVVQMTRKAVLPLELLRLDENQRYNYKLDDRQTSSMIKVAVTAPRERWVDIEHGLNMLKWSQDPFLKAYGMKIKAERTEVKARLLQNPKLQFGGTGGASVFDPRNSGRWDLKGKKFLLPNPAPLKSWGVCMIQGRYPLGKPECDRFIAEFIKSYKAHGGKVETDVPVLLQGTTDPGKSVEMIWNATGNKFQIRPQILVFILPDKDSTVYGRIKRACECRYGVVSQCMQSAHVTKCQPQYISNVLMKFNAKLGGVTNRAIGPTSSGAAGVFKVPTCIIGADVSHAAPGSQVASMAAMTVSTDKLATRYAAQCDTNGYRVEMITPENINKLLKPLLQNWVQNVGGGQFPKNIIYFRDGVSEGQFAHVLEQEVISIKKMLAAVAPNFPSKFIVIVASKRHHIRFFPKDGTGDRNGNPFPGTLVETGVTHPFENDFYLCSHSAIKGTARPVHYNVLLNEPALSNEELQTMIYEHCYQYIRATTPVSLFPAVYYAHLASNRAIHHDKRFGESAGRPSQAPSKAGKTNTSEASPQEFEPLMAMPDQAQINRSMWYI